MAAFAVAAPPGAAEAWALRTPSSSVAIPSAIPSGSGPVTPLTSLWSATITPALGAAMAAFAVTGRARRAPAATVRRVPRKFFNFFEPQPEQDPEDPGRVAVCGEYQNMPGQLVSAEQSDFGWATVQRHDASEQDGYWPEGATGGGEVTQEWRELKLAKAREDGGQPGPSDGTGQSVVKVSLCGDAAPVQVPYCMALGYTKSMCALAMTGAHLQGALPLDEDEMPCKRALVVGLGAGSMPVWLNHTFPKGKMIVDIVEIDPAVITIATGPMGFPKSALRLGEAAAAATDAVDGAGGETLRLYPLGGEAFVDALAATGVSDYKYDMVFLDAFDKAGKVPKAIIDPEGPFLKAIPALLAPKATVVLNLLVGMSGSGSSGGSAEIRAMVSAIKAACCQPDGEVFSARTPINESSGNSLYGFLTAGREGDRTGPLKEALMVSAQAINEGFPADSLGKKLRFEFERRVKFAYQDWKPPGAEKRSTGFF